MECTPKNLTKLNTVWQETFEGENFCELVKNVIFTEKTFVDCSLLPHQRTPLPQILQRKLSRIATKPQNLQKFLPRKFLIIRYLDQVGSYYHILQFFLYLWIVNDSTVTLSQGWPSLSVVSLEPGFQFQIYVSQLWSRKTKIWNGKPRFEAEQMSGIYIHVKLTHTRPTSLMCMVKVQGTAAFVKYGDFFCCLFFVEHSDLCKSGRS